MDLWHGALVDFVRTAGGGAIAGDMTRAFLGAHGALPGTSEVRSWDRSLAALADALRDLADRDVGVVLRSPRRGGAAAEAPVTAVGVSTEYHLPLSGRRIDVLLCGSDGAHRKTAVALELKQWSDVTLAEDDEENVRAAGAEHPHPSRQALDYAEWLAAYHSAFTKEGVRAGAVAWCHHLGAAGRARLHDARFAALLERSPLFGDGEAPGLASFLETQVGSGHGLDVLERVVGGTFAPSATVLARLEEVLRSGGEWHLLGEQRVAHQAIHAEVRRARASRGRRAVLVRGAPGTGKTVIAVQLLADAARLGWCAVHATGGKAFTTTLRSKFRGANGLFVWNWDFRKQPSGSVDLALVDEAHRLRTTSDTYRTPKVKRSDRSQIDEIFDASQVAVFFLDEHQFVRPNEIGTSAMVRAAAAARGIPLREFDLAAQFRCGGCTEYVAWVDGLLGFGPVAPPAWSDRYQVTLAERPEALEEGAAAATARGERARLLAGFCWPWSAPNPDGTLVPDVEIGAWRRPWNRKRDEKKSYSPRTDPYTLWAETDAGRHELGCVYSAQGFEFDHVGVIWGPDLVRRGDAWVAQPQASYDRPVRGAGLEGMQRLVRNAYRVLLTRGTRATAVLCLDAETHAYLRARLEGPRS